jgi:hypothetical protein
MGETADRMEGPKETVREFHRDFWLQRGASIEEAERLANWLDRNSLTYGEALAVVVGQVSRC